MEKLIQNVTRMDGRQADLLLRDGKVAEEAAAGTLAPVPQGEVVDGTGYLLLPPLVDAHAHLDKTVLGMDWFRNDLGPLLTDRIDHERESRRAIGLDPFVQAGRLIERSLSMGTMAMRSHVDVDLVNGLEPLEGVLAAREQYRDRFHVEVVAFPQSGLLVRPGTVALMDRALALGADLVGGVDPAAIDRDPKGGVDAIFDLAERHGKGVDIHLHEPGDLGAFTMELIAARTETSGMQGRVTISHALCLGGPNGALVASLVEKLARAGIAVTTGGQAYVPTVPSVKQLVGAGVNVCGGNDNIRDMWSPYGTGDMIERAQFIAMRNAFRRDDELELALEVCTEHGAKLLGLKDYGVAVGGRADFVLARARNTAECVAARPADRLVFQAGEMIARNGAYLG